jgi:hypothetical protein
MLRYLPALMPTLLFLAGPSADAHPPLPVPAMRQAIVDDLPGTYSNESNGGSCSVERRGRGYVFTNENGSWAFFVPAGPNYLVQRSGQWDPSVTATVIRDRIGRVSIRFDSPNSPPGLWVKTF